MKIPKKRFVSMSVAAVAALTSVYAIGANMSRASADAINNTDFVMTIDTTKAGTSGNNQFRIPTTGTGYNYTVDCDGNGTVDATGQTGDYICNYANPGVYSVRIGGTFPRIYFNDGDDKLKLISIDQWGTGAWTSMNSAFRGASNMDLKAKDAPNLSNVASISYMFANASSLKGEGANWNWDLSRVQFMDNVFYYASQFNQDISNWNTSNVTSMRSVFDGAHIFNQPIDKWDVSKVTDMFGMFAYSQEFNQPIGKWNTASLTNTRYMFRDTQKFDQSLENWKVDKLTNASEMFANSGISTVNYDKTLIGWNAQAVQNSVPFGAGSSKYCLAQTQRSNLINAKTWTITDGGTDCTPYQLASTSLSGSRDLSTGQATTQALGALTSSDSTPEATALDTFTYAIVGGANADYFRVDGNQLYLTKSVADLAGSSLTVVIRTTNAAGDQIDSTFVFSVTQAQAPANNATPNEESGDAAENPDTTSQDLAETGVSLGLFGALGVGLVGSALTLLKRR